jgi:hypothetical protein
MRCKEVPLPSKSASQYRFLGAAGHDPTFAKRAGIAQKVAKKLIAADRTKASVQLKSGATSSKT